MKHTARLLRPFAAISLAAVLLCAPGCQLTWPGGPGDGNHLSPRPLHHNPGRHLYG